MYDETTKFPRKTYIKYTNKQKTIVIKFLQHADDTLYPEDFNEMADFESIRVKWFNPAPMKDGIKKIYIIPITSPIYGQGENGPCVVGYTKGYRMVKD